MSLYIMNYLSLLLRVASKAGCKDSKICYSVFSFAEKICSYLFYKYHSYQESNYLYYFCQSFRLANNRNLHERREKENSIRN